MTIKAKVFLILGLILAVTGTSTAVTIATLSSLAPGLQETERSVASVKGDAVPLLATIKEIKADVIQVQQWLTDISATRGLPGFDDGFTEAEGFAKKFSEDVAIARTHAKALGMTDVLKALDGMEAAFPPFYAGGKKMAQAYIDTGPEGGNPMMEEFDTVAAAMGEATDKLVGLVESQTAATLDGLQALALDARESADGLVSFIFVAAAIGALVTIGGLILVFVTLSRSFGDLQHDVKLVMNRDYGEPFAMSPDRKDEFGPVAQALSGFLDSCSTMEKMSADQKATEERHMAEKRAAELKLADDFEASVGSIVHGVSAAATELQSSAETINLTADRANNRSASVASAAEQASANVQTVAAAAEQLSSSISEISRQVSESTQVAQAAVSEVQVTNEKVQGLAEAAGKIGEVINLITDIAEQTNLLALNATIEAARAGDAGKGFAVVAHEVKNLASQTAKATEEIGAQVSGIQNATEDAVTAIGSIGNTINQVSDIAAAIAAAVEEQGAATSEIARNVQEAASGTNEVSTNIVSVTEAAGETGHAAGQIQEASAELSQQSETLRQHVDDFIARVRAG